MSQKLFSAKAGFYFDIGLRNFGHQDKGISPQGAQDQTSFIVAYELLAKPESFQAIEIIYPPKEIIAEDDLLFVVCGAEYQSVKIADEMVAYNTVSLLKKGQTLILSGEKTGFRTIFIAIKKTAENLKLIGETKSFSLSEYLEKMYRNKFIRVIKGPEFDVLEDDSIFEQSWRLSPQSGQMGIALEGKKLITTAKQMISQPVTDGTVQLSPSGPIVLMRHRQTVGGYPRVLNVIDMDIDKLAQIPLGSFVRFRLISMDEAIRLNTGYQKSLEI